MSETTHTDGSWRGSYHPRLLEIEHPSGIRFQQQVNPERKDLIGATFHMIASANACAGLKDPAADLAALRKRVGELEAVCDMARRRYGSMWFGGDRPLPGSTIRFEFDAITAALAPKEP